MLIIGLWFIRLFLVKGIAGCFYLVVPIQMNAIPTRIRTRSSALALRFLSLNMSAPQANDIMTELLRTSDTTEIMESGSLSDEKYAKSPIHINIEISGIAQLQRKGVVW